MVRTRPMASKWGLNSTTMTLSDCFGMKGPWKDAVTFADGSIMSATFTEHGWVTGGMTFHDKDNVQMFNLAQLPRQLKRLEVQDDHLTGDIKDLPGSLEVLKMPKSTKLTGDLKDLQFPFLIYIELHKNERITGDLHDLRPGLRNRT